MLFFPHVIVGEDKTDGEMQEAVDDIKEKLADMSIVHYGSLPFIMAYTAAGLVIQFHSVFWTRNEARQVRSSFSKQST
jgi:hypothetical protein